MIMFIESRTMRLTFRIDHLINYTTCRDRKMFSFGCLRSRYVRFFHTRKHSPFEWSCSNKSLLIPGINYHVHAHFADGSTGRGQCLIFLIFVQSGERSLYRSLVCMCMCVWWIFPVLLCNVSLYTKRAVSTKHWENNNKTMRLALPPASCPTGCRKKTHHHRRKASKWDISILILVDTMPKYQPTLPHPRNVPLMEVEGKERKSQ